MTEAVEQNGADKAETKDAGNDGAEDAAKDGDKEKSPGGFTRRIFNKDETLVKEGEKGDCVFVIKRGKVEIRKGVHTPKPRILNTLGPGNVVAEFALFDNLPHSADVIAMEETEVVALSRPEFEARLRAMDPVLRTAVMGLMAKARHMVNLAADSKSGRELI